MAFTPNKEQQDFIDTKNVSVLVSASAGSGKTTTMVHKLIDIICKDRVSIQDLLIVTYTNASASEMKQKVYNAILEKIRETTDEDLLEFLYNELENVNVADIGTLHSVCKKILSKYFYKIDQNPSFRLIIDKERDYLFTTTIDKVIKRHIVDLKDEFYVLYENFSQKRNMSVLYGVVNKIYTFLITKPNYESWVEIMYNTCYTDLENNVCARYILDYSSYNDIAFGDDSLIADMLIKKESILQFLHTSMSKKTIFIK